MNAREVSELIAAQTGQSLRGDGGAGYLVSCPAHDDHEPSLHISSGKSQAVLVKCLAGCETVAVLTQAGLRWRDLCDGRVRGTWSEPTEEYLYTDKDGRHLFTIWRFGHGEGKRFRCYRFADDGRVIRETRTVPRVLYQLPEVLEAVRRGETIYLCEGEKDADAMRAAWGVTATTNPFGATAWAKDSERHGYAEMLRHATVVVVQHADATGRKRTRQISLSLAGLAAEVRIVRAAVGNDAYDHLAAGLALEEFVAVSDAEIALADDGSFAALPQVFCDAAGACNLTHLEYRVLFEIARHSVRRECGQVIWQAIPCPSSWLAKCCGNASPSAVRGSRSRMRDAGLLLADNSSASSTQPGAALVLRVNGHYDAWRSLRRTSSSNQLEVSFPRTAPVSCKDTNTREDLGLREEGI